MECIYTLLGGGMTTGVDDIDDDGGGVVGEGVDLGD